MRKAVTTTTSSPKALAMRRRAALIEKTDRLFAELDRPVELSAILFRIALRLDSAPPAVAWPSLISEAEQAARTLPRWIDNLNAVTGAASELAIGEQIPTLFACFPHSYRQAQTETFGEAMAQEVLRARPTLCALTRATAEIIRTRTARDPPSIGELLQAIRLEEDRASRRHACRREI